MAYQGTALDEHIRRNWAPPEHMSRRPVPATSDKKPPGQGNDDWVMRHGFHVPRSCLREDRDVSLGASTHPRHTRYDLDALTRSRLLHIRRPSWTLAEWSAAAQWGLEYFVDSADTCALTSGVTRHANGPEDVSRRRRTRQLLAIPTVRTDPHFPHLRVTPPILTLIHCLRSVLGDGHSWHVPHGAGLTDSGLRAVQLIDSLCRTFRIDPDDLPAACAHHIDQDFLRTVVGFCDRGADSPPETLMRLMVRSVAAAVTTEEFTSQLVVHADGSVSDPVHGGPTGPERIVARLDLGCANLKLAFQYDGSGHLAVSTRGRDSRVNTELSNLEWHVLRLTWGHLKDRGLLRATVLDGIRVCEQRHSQR
ncbi:hypothetical protein BJF89_12110 [Corynebacterium sp. CNJ-954]|uniref:hypothetical protein n=1 Tax=Corynebacterium sp. CNJ-954 TaxID=1904962 RepID=UPI000968FD5F|nr:hypothetical protein [Corynebacterium sp. CNJ-954]OLT56162.1 hypothetical protein BJF89_12110 [Corynebacterium sp. CNJ-954]